MPIAYDKTTIKIHGHCHKVFEFDKHKMSIRKQQFDHLYQRIVNRKWVLLCRTKKSLYQTTTAKKFLYSLKNDGKTAQVCMEVAFYVFLRLNLWCCYIKLYYIFM